MNKQPLYKQIVDFIINKINSNEYLPNDPIPNERELAELFNVSRITSKRALDELKRLGIIYRIIGSGSYVSPSDKISIFQSNIKNALSENDKKIVALVIPIDPSVSGLIEMISGATKVFNIMGYLLTVHNSKNSEEKEREIVKRLISNKVSGIILYPFSSMSNVDFYINLLMEDFPLVTIDKFFESIPLPSVVSDNFEGSYKVTQSLIDSGHSKIAFMSGQGIEYCTSIQNRSFGYCKALRDNHIHIDNEIVFANYVKFGKSFDDPHFDEYIENIMKELIKKNVTAIQVVNDGEAVLIQRSCQKAGYSIPNDICITGFDDISLSSFVTPPITTVRQDFKEMGEKAAQLILTVIESKKHSTQPLVIPVELIKRESSNKIVSFVSSEN